MSEFKLKGLTSLNLKDGELKEVEVEGIEEGKILLSKSGGKINATGSKCTHYGAPLAKGVMDSNGNVVCPWHGACFKLSTGDVEDAPALDALETFKVVEKDGGVYVQGEEAKIKSGRRLPSITCKAQGKDQIIVVGGGSGTIGFVQALREQGSTANVTILSKDEPLPLDRTKLSKALIADAEKLQWRGQDWYDSAAIKNVKDEVTKVDPKSKTVTTASGKKYEYSKLVLATGGTPKRLPLEGFKELKNIFVLRKVSDVQEILAAVGEKKGKKIVVVGSSFIGMEVGNALAKENTVTIIGMEKQPLETVMGAEIGKVFRSQLEKSGVKFCMDASVDKATASSSDSSSVGAVHLKDGTTLEADLVVLGVGVAPATEFLKDSGFELEKDGAIQVDETFAVKGQDSIFAIGDIAKYPYHGPGGNGTPVRIEHWNVAQNAGRSVALTLAKPSSSSTASNKQFIPVFWSALGAQLRYCGNTVNGYDDVIIKGKPDEGSFAAYYTKDDTVLAVATMGMDPIVAQSIRLMKEGSMLSASQLRDGGDVMSVAVTA